MSALSKINSKIRRRQQKVWLRRNWKDLVASVFFGMWIAIVIVSQI